MAKIALVTGGSGFIGSWLIGKLKERGFEVRALMRRTSSDSNLRGLEYSRVEGDLGDFESLKRASDGATHVFHLAGAITAPNRDGFFRHNAEGTRNLARAVAETSGGSLERFVYVSSLAAGGPAEKLEPRTESDPDRPVSHYGESKLEGERELLAFRDRFPITIVRPPLVYGPRDKATFIFVQTVSRNLLPVFGEKYYSTVHVADLCEGIIRGGLVSGDRVASGEVFYVSSDDVTTYEGLMSTIARELRRRPFRVPVPRPLLRAAAAGFTALGRVTGKTYSLNLDKLNEIEPDFWICSNEKAKSQLGFKPQYDLSSGMSDAIRWYRSERWVR